MRRRACPSVKLFAPRSSPASERGAIAFGFDDVPDSCAPMLAPAAFGFTPGSVAAGEEGETVGAVCGLLVVALGLRERQP